MTLSDLMLKIEKMLAECSEDELYMLWSGVNSRAGREMMRQKIAKMIVYRENQKLPQPKNISEALDRARKLREDYDNFEKIMKGNGYEKTA